LYISARLLLSLYSSINSIVNILNDQSTHVTDYIIQDFGYLYSHVNPLALQTLTVILTQHSLIYVNP